MNTCKILLTIFQYLIIQQNGDQKNDDDVLIEPQEISPYILNLMQEVVEKSLKILITPDHPNQQVFLTTYGTQQKAFGSGKIKLLELINMSFKLNFNEETLFFTEEILKTLLSYMVQFSFNNFVQSGIEKILSSIIESNNKDLKKIVHILSSCLKIANF